MQLVMVASMCSGRLTSTILSGCPWPMIHFFSSWPPTLEFSDIPSRLISGYAVLNQQNGIINPPNGKQYNQGAWHRDLPYQHFVSSRPLAINALFCLDPFTIENGATMVLPASHRQKAFTSDLLVKTQALPVAAPAGSFIVLDCMVFHSGGVNTTAAPRRAVNHVYTIPLIRQQIDMPSALGDEFTADSNLRRLLGYNVRQPRSVAEYLAGRQGVLKL